MLFLAEKRHITNENVFEIMSFEQWIYNTILVKESEGRNRKL